MAKKVQKTEQHQALEGQGKLEEMNEFYEALMFMRKMSMRPHTIVSAMESSDRGKLIELIWALSDEWNHLRDRLDYANTVALERGERAE